MHLTVKTVFRMCFAAVIFFITISLVWTCISKLNEIRLADQTFQNAQTIHLVSTKKEQLVLISNNQKPDPAIYIAIAQNGYIAKISCEHYANICTDQYNQQQTRQIHQVDLLKVGYNFYIHQVKYTDSRTQHSQEFKYDQAQIQQAYQQDINNLKYTVFGIGLFSCAALFVSFRILVNFKKFLNK
ncbi:hypothetical protein DYI81_15320 [Acinetobacter sp. SWAC5]|uniref:hypothetical protein n=1 Tax=Acinetobacter sp. SWAC5 TaxID=2293835 RepID=UPI000E34B67F|nr:hypothetical protein [Acinetobacter sp. SWAC5]RFS27756.1 hypothetical protein DYI81_15320 [Acinetobacter sp. SWAC5]